jgi:phosphoribosylamine--glycine ligase
MDDRAAATVVMVSEGYPGPYQKGKVITGIEEVTSSMVFQAGTRRNEKGELVTSGGRVLSVTSYGNTIQEALDLSYENARRIQFDGAHLRSDIGFDL